ncbi:MAG: formate dehydrogenase accessory sulfurtransferase FdhD, partial [bacterium]|nr:formate dehydrogenase accessory sulfurtransferase FdhD [bacterium]
ATRARIPLVVSRSSPTDLALSLADSLNVTVLGFVRGTRFNIYTHFQRIIFA